jgi:hypothetical protein
MRMKRLFRDLSIRRINVHSTVHSLNLCSSKALFLQRFYISEPLCVRTYHPNPCRTGGTTMVSFPGWLEMAPLSHPSLRPAGSLCSYVVFVRISLFVFVRTVSSQSLQNWWNDHGLVSRLARDGSLMTSLASSSRRILDSVADERRWVQRSSRWWPAQPHPLESPRPRRHTTLVALVALVAPSPLRSFGSHRLGSNQVH